MRKTILFILAALFILIAGCGSQAEVTESEKIDLNETLGFFHIYS